MSAPRHVSKFLRDWPAFRSYIKEAGAKILPAKTSYELVRITCIGGECTLRQSTRGRLSWPPALYQAWLAMERGVPSLRFNVFTDRRAYRSALAAENSPRKPRKKRALSDAEVEHVRRLLATTNETRRAIGQRFGVSHSTISKVANGRHPYNTGGPAGG